MEIVQKGILFGIFAGILDVFFLLFENITLSLSISLFLTCVVCGLFIATTKSNIRGAWRGGSIAILLLAPQFIFLVEQSGNGLIPQIVATILLCVLIGHIIDQEKEVQEKVQSRKPKSALYKESKIGVFKE